MKKKALIKTSLFLIFLSCIIVLTSCDDDYGWAPITKNSDAREGNPDFKNNYYIKNTKKNSVGDVIDLVGPTVILVHLAYPNGSTNAGIHLNGEYFVTIYGSVSKCRHHGGYERVQIKEKVTLSNGSATWDPQYYYVLDENGDVIERREFCCQSCNFSPSSGGVSIRKSEL